MQNIYDARIEKELEIITTVVGLYKFKEFSKKFHDEFVVIGGAACDVILEDSKIEPCATDDIDMILIVDKKTPEFGSSSSRAIIKQGSVKEVKEKNLHLNCPTLSNRIWVILPTSNCRQLPIA